jgi:hypothetical protein
MKRDGLARNSEAEDTKDAEDTDPASIEKTDTFCRRRLVMEVLGVMVALNRAREVKI